ncbi:MAG: hypothetical protein GY842_16685 [bacterium]|nr:hypothetical protein [bacterium]
MLCSAPRVHLVVAWASLLGSGLALAGPRFSTEVNNPFGLHGPQYSHWLHGNTPHLWVEGEARLRVLEDTGAGWARQDFWWSLVEPRRDTFVWKDFDRAVADYERHGLNLLAILCYASAWSGESCPATDEERERFGRYVYEMVKRYKGRVAAWEVWNEPNIQPFWSPRPDPELYARLLRAACVAAKKADPNCTVIGGVLAGPHAEFLEGMYQHGAGGYFDALSYHNYGQQLDIAAEWSAVEKLRGIMRAHGDADKPIWHTETGFFTGPAGLSEHDQAARIVRHSVGLLALGVERTFQLTLNDWTDDSQHHDLSAYRGLTHADYRLKESYGAYRTMCQRLGNKRFVAAVRPAPGVSGYLFQDDHGDTVLVMWRAWGFSPTPTGIDIGLPVVLVQQMNGDWQMHRSPDGRYQLPLGAAPVYVINPGDRIVYQRDIRWPNPVLTRVPRSADATLTAEVANPSPQPLELTVYPHRLASRRYVAGGIEPGSVTRVQVDLDASLLDVGQHEFYWVLAHQDAAKPIAQGYRLVEVESPLRVFLGRFNRLVSSAPALPVSIEHQGGESARGSVSLRLDERTIAGPLSVELAPGETTAVALPLELGEFLGGRAVPLEVVLESQGLTLTTRCRRPLIPCPQAPPEASVDGDLSEWTERLPQVKPAQMRWAQVNPADQSPEDLQVTAWVAYDPRGLWVAVRVRDDTITAPTGRAVWNWDSLQVGLDLAGDAQPNHSFDTNDLEIELGLNPQGDSWCYLGYCPPGWPAEQLSERLVGAVRMDARLGIVSYELLIPASLLASQTVLSGDTVMGFSLLVNDNDGNGRSGWQELTPGIGMEKAPASFAWLWLR